jgi:hypothetical protein
MLLINIIKRELHPKKNILWLPGIIRCCNACIYHVPGFW